MTLSLLSFLLGKPREMRLRLLFEGHKKKIFFSLALAIIFLILGFFDHYLLSSYIGLMIFSLYLAVIGRLSTE